MKTAYLALGSNLGDRAAQLRAALALLASAELQVETLSSVFETPPVGITEQPRFLNMAVEVLTSLTPIELLQACLGVEVQLGRVRQERWGPRTIDIDLLWYDGYTSETAELTLPHPRLHERAFVLLPFAEIAPGLLVHGRTVAVWAALQDATGVVNLGSLAEQNSG